MNRNYFWKLLQQVVAKHQKSCHHCHRSDLEGISRSSAILFLTGEINRQLLFELFSPLQVDEGRVEGCFCWRLQTFSQIWCVVDEIAQLEKYVSRNYFTLTTNLVSLSFVGKPGGQTADQIAERIHASVTVNQERNTCFGNETLPYNSEISL